MPSDTDRLATPLALLSAVVAFLILSKLRHMLDSAVLSGSPLWRTLSITLLFVIALTPAVLAAALRPSRWLVIGVVAAYLSQLIWQLIQLSLPLTSGVPFDRPLYLVVADAVLSGVPNAALGVAGAALGLVIAQRAPNNRWRGP
jgi:hypothetical protein